MNAVLAGQGLEEEGIGARHSAALDFLSRGREGEQERNKDPVECECLRVQHTFSQLSKAPVVTSLAVASRALVKCKAPMMSSSRGGP